MVSVGDNKTYKVVSNLNLYEVSTEECLNHASKRLGPAFRNLRAGGRGGLIDVLVKYLQRCYVNTIRGNRNNLDRCEMQYGLPIITEYQRYEEPWHQHCSDQWCFYKKTIVQRLEMPKDSRAIGTRIRRPSGGSQICLHETDFRGSPVALRSWHYTICQ